MINSLLRLLGDSNLEELQNRLYAGLENLKKTFGAAFTSLEDKGEYYELVLDVADDAKASNVTVDYDDDTRELDVTYEYKGEHYTNKSVVKEVLPDDADENDIEATVEDGQLTITIGKKEEEEEPEEEVDDTVVKINRKNRK